MSCYHGTEPSQDNINLVPFMAFLASSIVLLDINHLTLGQHELASCEHCTLQSKFII